MLRRARCLLIALTVCLLPAAPVGAYVDLAPTLGRIVRESTAIAIVEVDRFNSEKGMIILKKVRDLKGEVAAGPIKHQVMRPNESSVDRPILEWAEPGRRCVMFISGNTTLVCIGEGWYQVHASKNEWWQAGASRPDLPLAYFGTISRLSEAVALMLADKAAIITALPHGADQEGASFDLALNRASLPGLVKIQRSRAHLGMPPMVMAVSTNPAFVVGMGRADQDEIPSLRTRLRESDATMRAESAADLGSLGPKAAVAAEDLTKLLDDAAPMVRMAAAAALLRISPKDARALEALSTGLSSEDARVRRHAARAAGLAGPAAAALVGKFGALLTDPDALIRRSALQAIATLGPAAGAAVEQVTPLLGKSETAIDAADALGRIGPAARSALKPLSEMLTAEAKPQRWAAVRAMSQIGGEGAMPAVKFMIAELPDASTVDGYNMMIYLALLGPVAKDAIPAVQRSNLRNPFLRQTTVWAINPGTELPWLGGIGGGNVVQWVMESYAHELGDHIKPVAVTVARKIMAGTAGEVPSWGYKLLARFPEQSLSILSPGLEDEKLIVRERAAVALGYMGSAAAPAKPHVEQALRKTKDQREQLLLKWCLRSIE
jgi:HEAT repeat protein